MHAARARCFICGLLIDDIIVVITSGYINRQHSGCGWRIMDDKWKDPHSYGAAEQTVMSQSTTNYMRIVTIYSNYFMWFLYCLHDQRRINFTGVEEQCDTGIIDS